MPKDKVSDLITDQEIAFARLILSGAMTDRHAAEAVGLNPDSAAYTKAKPRVRAYMLEHRAAVQQQLVQQEADLSRRAVDGLRNLGPDREQVLARLWEIANLSPEMTRSSVTGQVKALSMIIAMQNFIPDRHAPSAEKKSVPALPRAQIYAAAWLGEQKATTNDPQPSPTTSKQEHSPAEPEPATNSAAEAPPDPGPSRSAFVNRFTPAEAPEPYVPLFASVPNTRVGFSIKKNPFRPR
jgi:hypothetical protein